MRSPEISPFDDDEASDFAAEILKSEGIGIVAEAVYAVPDEDWEFVEHGTCVRALVAAELIADQRGHESGDIPDELHSWVHQFGDSDDFLINRAYRAVERVLRDSQTRERWSESVMFKNWYARMKDLLYRLE